MHRQHHRLKTFRYVVSGAFIGSALTSLLGNQYKLGVGLGLTQVEQDLVGAGFGAAVVLAVFLARLIHQHVVD